MPCAMPGFAAEGLPPYRHLRATGWAGFCGSGELSAARRHRRIGVCMHGFAALAQDYFPVVECFLRFVHGDIGAGLPARRENTEWSFKYRSAASFGWWR